MPRTVRIGTRGSLLARTQTEQVAVALRAANPGLLVETIIVRTTGDARADVPFAAVGTKGMFVKEIEEALLAGEIDLGVHSLKDMPGELPEGLVLAATPAREDPRDALVGALGQRFLDLPDGSRIGTSSPRRSAQLRAARPDLRVAELRGNLDTRLRKLDEGHYDAIVLAAAGLHRLGREDRISERLDPQISLPAVGQGALALETRSDDAGTRELVSVLNHVDTADAVAAERAFLAAVGGGCTVPIAALARIDGELIELQALIAAPDGSALVRDRRTAHRSDAEALGAEMAAWLLESGGRALLKG